MKNFVKGAFIAATLAGVAQVSAVAAGPISIPGRPTLTPTNPASPPRVTPPPPPVSPN